MAVSSGRSLDTPTLSARIALIFDLQVGSTVSADTLALSLLARRDTRERRLIQPRTGTLPERRLAAKLLEHAAREAVLRYQQDDPYPTELLLSDGVMPSFTRLLSDREPLVWRHAAVARGLLAGADRAVREEIETALDPSLTPTEWRRAAVSLVALMATDPEVAFQQCRTLTKSEVGRRDPGVMATMLLGLPRVIEAEPDAAEELFELLVATGRLDVAEAGVDLLGDVTLPSFGVRAREQISRLLSQAAKQRTGALRAVAEHSLRRLMRSRDSGNALHEGVREALSAYESRGAKAAYGLALVALSDAQETMQSLETSQSGDPELDAAQQLAMLADLDAAVLQRARLYNLLLLSRRSGDTDTSVPGIAELYDRLGRWILAGEESHDAASGPGGELARQRRLVSLLHLVDTEGVRSDTVDESNLMRHRLKAVLATLLKNLAGGPPAGMHRVLCATLARTLDAAVREGVAEPSDVLLLVMRHVTELHSLATLTEASTSPDVQKPLAAFAHFVDPHLQINFTGRGSIPPTDPELDDAVDDASAARKVVRLSHALSAGGLYRGEALRQVALKLGRALESLASARCKTELLSAGATDSQVAELEWATDALRQMMRGATQRVLERDDEGAIAVVTDVPPLSQLMERTLNEGVPPNDRQLDASVRELVADLPPALASVIERIGRRVAALPNEAESSMPALPLERRRVPLPDWLLPRRTIGSFYVVRSLGSGGGSTVFVARRMEARHDPAAELFALKVPQYDPTTARSLTEQEFLQMFREEAGALLALPSHPNLARFVTFDLAARPKPILVMELIEGSSLDRLVRSRSLTVQRVMEYLDGILAGLKVMHDAGLGHLDLKPSNVILRDGATPVLVDFGLSGRQLRPGCGSLDYCAPEVLGLVPEGHTPTPQAADIYAFGCTAFELLTAQPLFDGEDEMVLATQHVSHDGWPARLAALDADPRVSPLARTLALCLRRDPRNRTRVEHLRATLAQLAPQLRSVEWPISPQR